MHYLRVLIVLVAALSAGAVWSQSSSQSPAASPPVKPAPNTVSKGGGGNAVFVAATWSDTAVHFLDGDLNDMGSFPASESNPNGIATDGVLIYTGHFTTQEVIAYNFSGVEQFRWSATLPSLQGMDLVNGELAVYQDGNSNIVFFNPANGTLIRSIPGAEASGIEGLAFDGTLLWQLGDRLYGADPADGSVVKTVDNPLAGCDFTGSGLAANAPGQLIVACTDGRWKVVATDTGVAGVEGDNGLDMYGLKAVQERGFAFSAAIPALSPFGLALLGLLLVVSVVGWRRWRGAH